MTEPVEKTLHGDADLSTDPQAARLAAIHDRFVIESTEFIARVRNDLGQLTSQWERRRYQRQRELSRSLSAIERALKRVEKPNFLGPIARRMATTVRRILARVKLRRDPARPDLAEALWASIGFLDGDMEKFTRWHWNSETGGAYQCVYRGASELTSHVENLRLVGGGETLDAPTFVRLNELISRWESKSCQEFGDVVARRWSDIDRSILAIDKQIRTFNNDKRIKSYPNLEHWFERSLYWYSWWIRLSPREKKTFIELQETAARFLMKGVESEIEKCRKRLEQKLFDGNKYSIAANREFEISDDEEEEIKTEFSKFIEEIDLESDKIAKRVKFELKEEYVYVESQSFPVADFDSHDQATYAGTSEIFEREIRRIDGTMERESAKVLGVIEDCLSRRDRLLHGLSEPTKTNVTKFDAIQSDAKDIAFRWSSIVASHLLNACLAAFNDHVIWYWLGYRTQTPGEEIRLLWQMLGRPSYGLGLSASDLNERVLSESVVPENTVLGAVVRSVDGTGTSRLKRNAWTWHIEQAEEKEPPYPVQQQHRLGALEPGATAAGERRDGRAT